LSRLYALDNEEAAFRPSIDELERYNHDTHEAIIFDNRHTTETLRYTTFFSLFPFGITHEQKIVESSNVAIIVLVKCATNAANFC